MVGKAKQVSDKICQTCGISFNRTRFASGVLEDLTRYRARRFCSISCAGVRQNVKPQAFHQQARKFRGEKCETCGTTENLHVHHVDHNPRNNDPSNLQTLCASCHLKLHWAIGRTLPKRQSVCKICGEPAKSLDMCQKHYQRFRKYGEPCLTKRGNGLGVYFVREDSSGSLSRCSPPNRLIE